MIYYSNISAVLSPMNVTSSFIPSAVWQPLSENAAIIKIASKTILLAIFRLLKNLIVVNNVSSSLQKQIIQSAFLISLPCQLSSHIALAHIDIAAAGSAYRSACILVQGEAAVELLHRAAAYRARQNSGDKRQRRPRKNRFVCGDAPEGRYRLIQAAQRRPVFFLKEYKSFVTPDINVNLVFVSLEIVNHCRQAHPVGGYSAVFDQLFGYTLILVPVIGGVAYSNQLAVRQP